ncbi:MAG TPA: hypothetical protein VEQ38_05685 [Verrucomicrobiae bacterium]|nr:hypothetical protein [Verrucomicrobiae bacterium]
MEDAVDRSYTDDVGTPEVFAALDYLAARGTIKWPFAQFRKPLITQDREFDVDKEGRRQILNASLNGIKRSVAFREE